MENDIPSDSSDISRAMDWARQTSAKLITSLSRPLGNKDARAMVNVIFDKQFGLGLAFLKER